VPSIGSLQAIAAEAAGDGVHELIIDLRNVTFIDASTIRAPLIGRELTIRQGCVYRVINARDFVHSVLAVAGVLRILDVRTTISTREGPSAVIDRKPRCGHRVKRGHARPPLGERRTE
jgi:anti-anti-sigma factor